MYVLSFQVVLRHEIMMSDTLKRFVTSLMMVFYKKLCSVKSSICPFDDQLVCYTMHGKIDEDFKQDSMKTDGELWQEIQMDATIIVFYTTP